MNKPRTPQLFLGVIIISALIGFATCVDINSAMPSIGYTSGMPSRTVMEKFGLFDFFGDNLEDLPGVSNVYHGKDADSIEITFNGTAETIKAITDYFSPANGWAQDTSSVDGELAYKRGDYYGPWVTFNPTVTPFTLNIYREINGFDIVSEWPDVGLLKKFQIPDLPKPTNSERINYIEENTEDNTLYISFIMDASDASKQERDALIDQYTRYFNDPKWTPNPKAQTTATNFSYLCGLATVNFHAELNPFFEIHVYKNIIDVEGIPEWPNKDILKKYGLYELPEPNGITSPTYTISKDQEDDVLSIEFHATPEAHTALFEYFSNWVSDGDTPQSMQRTRGFTYVSYNYPEDGYDLYEDAYYLYVNKPLNLDIVDGWPGDTTKRKFGISDLVSPANATSQHYAIDGNVLSILFNGAANTEADVKAYFADKGWAEYRPFDPTHDTYDPNYVADPDFDEDRDFMYSRGITFVVFTTSASPYYELSVSTSIEDAGDNGWPVEAVLKKHGLHGMTQPSGIMQVEQTPPMVWHKADKDDTGNDQLAIRFYGTATTENAVKRYFSGNNWTEVTTTTDANGATVPFTPPVGELHFQRGVAFVVFDISVSPYYEITATIDYEEGHVIGWPSSSLLAKWLPPKFIAEPSDATHKSHYEIAETADDGGLEIGFYGTDANEKAIFDYFANDWKEENQDTSSADYDRNVRYFTRFGTTALVSVAHKPYYRIEVSKSGVPTWPGEETLEAYGLQGIPKPNSSEFSHLNESAQNELSITFRDDNGSEKTVLDYFDAKDNGWTPVYKITAEGSTVEVNVPTGERHYSRGIAYVVFSISDATMCQISVSRTLDGTEGWPSAATLNEYGLHGLTTTAPQGITYSNELAKSMLWNKAETDEYGNDLFAIWFYGTTPAAGQVVADYFDNVANNWTPIYNVKNESGVVIETFPLTERHYSRGIAYVVFYTAPNSPYFEIALTRTLEGNQGLPSVDLLNGFGLQGMNLSAGSASGIQTGTTLRNFVDGNDLYIQFYGTVNTTETTINNYFKNNNWTEVTTTTDASGATVPFTPPAGEYHYQRGIAYVVFDTSERPYYEIATMRSMEGTLGWPAAELLSSFGLQRLVLPEGVNNGNVRHFYDPDNDDELAIRFNGTNASKTAMLEYFSVSNNGWTEVKIGENGKTLPTTILAYSRGITTVTFDFSGGTFYEIYASRSYEGIPEWPDSSKLMQYGLHGLGKPQTATTYSYYEEEGIDENGEEYDALVIRFYGSENDETFIRDYFGVSNGWDVGDTTPSTSVFSRGIAYVVFDTSVKPYYELYISRDVEGIPEWPENNTLEAYGLQGIPKPNSSLIWNFVDESDALVIRFYGENTLQAYFDNNWTFVASSDGVYDYTRGIFYAAFDTSSKPYYEIYISKEDPGTPDWPKTDLITKYGLQGLPLPTTAYNITHLEDAGVDEAGEDYEGLLIRFYGEPAAAAISTYLNGNGWEFSGTLLGVSSYSRGTAYLSFDTSAPPYYEIYVSLSEDAVPGWPRRETLESFGLHGLAAIIPTDAESVTHDPSVADELTIEFQGVNAGNTIRAYFDNTINNWTRLTTTTNESGATVPVPAGEYHYSRGIADVVIKINGDWCTIAVSSNIEEGFDTGWPLQTLLNSYGLLGMLPPSGTSPTTIWHKAGIEKDENGNDYAAMTIRFYGIEFIATDNSFRYFADNNWQLVTDENGNLVPVPTGEYHYSRGIAYLVFTTSGKPYYEIEVTLETVEGSPGWPQSAVLDSFGLSGIAPLPNRPDMNITHYLYEANNLVMQFYGSDADEKTIRDYFTSATNWKDENDDTTKVYEYERGIIDVTIDTSGKPYYLITVSRNVDDLNQGWPSTALLNKYGFADMPFSSASPTAYVWHGVTTDATTGSETLEIHFFGDSRLNEAEVLAYFTGKNWIEDTYSNPAGQDYSYERGLISANFVASHQPYYFLGFAMEDPGTPGWPSATLLNDYGLLWLTATAPTGASEIYHRQDHDDDDLTYDSLTIRFNGTLATESVIRGYFSATNNWVIDTDLGSPNDVYYKSKGVASVVRFDTSAYPAFLISVERELEGTANWPAANVLNEYGLYNLPSLPTTAMGTRWYEETDDDGEMLFIRFYGPTNGVANRAAFETSIRALFPTAATTTGGGWTAETTTGPYSRGIAHATIDTTNWPYYEIQVSREAGAVAVANNSQLPSTVLQKHGVSGLTVPTGATNVFYIDDDDQLTIMFHHATLATVTTARTTYFSVANGWTAETATGSVYPYSKGSTSVEFDSSKTFFHMITVEKVGELGLPDSATLATYMLGGLTQTALTNAGVTAGSIRRVEDTNYLAIMFEVPSTTNTATFETAINSLLTSIGWEMEALSGTGVAALYAGSREDGAAAGGVATRHIDFTVGTRPYYTIEVDK